MNGVVAAPPSAAGAAPAPAAAGPGPSVLGKHPRDEFGDKKRKKIYVPVLQFPDINFLGTQHARTHARLDSRLRPCVRAAGLLIGPRGSTQKYLQDETNTKILMCARTGYLCVMLASHRRDCVARTAVAAAQPRSPWCGDAQLRSAKGA